MILIDEKGNPMSSGDINYKKGWIDIVGEQDGEQLVVYRLFTENQLKNNEYKKKILELKKKLQESDYEAIKYAEGWFTEEEYKPIKEKRENIRKEIRALEEKITNDYQGENY